MIVGGGVAAGLPFVEESGFVFSGNCAPEFGLGRAPDCVCPDTSRAQLEPLGVRRLQLRLGLYHLDSSGLSQSPVRYGRCQWPPECVAIARSGGLAGDPLSKPGEFADDPGHSCP